MFGFKIRIYQRKKQEMQIKQEGESTVLGDNFYK